MKYFYNMSLTSLLKITFIFVILKSQGCFTFFSLFYTFLYSFLKFLNSQYCCSLYCFLAPNICDSCKSAKRIESGSMTFTENSLELS